MLKLRSDVKVVPLALAHAPNMFRWMCDPVIRKNIGLRSEPSLERTEAWIKNALQDPTMCPFAVLLDNQHVGNVVLDRIDSYLASARLSVYIGEPSARRAGVGLTAVYRALLEGFQNLSLHKIWLTVHCQNYAAIHMYTKLGFTLEGILRDEFWLDGQRVNVLYMGLLHDDLKRLAIEVEKDDG